MDSAMLGCRQAEPPGAVRGLHPLPVDRANGVGGHDGACLDIRIEGGG